MMKGRAPDAFGRSFASRYGGEVAFFPGTPLEALAAATQSAKACVVYLHSDAEVETQLFCGVGRLPHIANHRRAVLTHLRVQVLVDTLVSQTLNEHFVVVGWDAGDPLAYQALQESLARDPEMASLVRSACSCVVMMAS